MASLDRLSSPTLYDYHDGGLYRRMCAGLGRFAAENDEALVCLRMTTDRFKLHEGRRKQRSAWSVAFTVLNYDCKTRFQARNSLTTSFIPGGHDSDHFDTFLRPTVQEML